MLFKKIPKLVPYSINRYGIVINKKTNKIEKQFKNNAGYMTVNLTPTNRKRKSYFVHRLVCMAFHPQNNLRLHVNHKDLDRTNNYYRNLEWCTPSENARHSAYLNDKYKQTPIFTRDVYTKIVKQYDSIFSCAKSLRLSKDAISYRVNSMFGSIFDGYQFKRVNDKRDWIELNNIEVLTKQKEYLKLIYLRKNGIAVEYQSQREAAKHLNISETTMNKFIKLRHIFKFNGYTLHKRYDNNWDINTLPEWYSKLCPRYRIIDDCEKTFTTLVELAKFLKLKPTTLFYKLKKTKMQVVIIGNYKIEVL